jgi:predicted nucleic acid-binding protein
MNSRRPRSTLAYLDTNVFDNLIKKTNGVTDADEEQLRASVSSRRLTIVVSHITIRETLAALNSCPDIARAQLKLIASLADWDRFVRFSSEILEDDIRHFAFNGEAANTPFEKNAAHIRSKVQLIIEGRIGFGELEAVIGEDREYKTGFLDTVRRANAGTASELEEFRKANTIPSFEEFFEDGMEPQVLAFVESFGVAEECKRRGLDKLSRIPSIRALIGLGMSFMYRTSVEKKSPKSSAARDIQHAVSAASAADVFVTHDEELSFMLDRVPIRRFQVLRLHELLNCAN